MDPEPNTSPKADLERERQDLLDRITNGLETPMILLAFVWLALLVAEFVTGEHRGLRIVSNVIWILFIVDFVLKFSLAPRKLRFLAVNWLTVLSLAIPALRIFRAARLLPLLRAAKVSRGLRLVRVLSSANRGMKAIASSMKRRGLGYVIVLTLVVEFAGAAGMYAFEHAPEEGKPVLESYTSALWWTAMILTTMGSENWPTTPEGRVLCLLLAIYAFTIFGYITASLASFFVGRDAVDDEAELAGAKQLESLRQEIAQLRDEIRRLRPPGGEAHHD